jgi:hypothetical protein
LRTWTVHPLTSAVQADLDMQDRTVKMPLAGSAGVDKRLKHEAILREDVGNKMV